MKKFITLLVVLFLLPLTAIAQANQDDKEKKEDKPQRPAFESAWLVDNPTNVVFNKGTLEVMMQHRFDFVDGSNTLLGFYGAANIRIAVAYSPIDRVALGFGTTKDYRLQDFNWKG